MKTVCIQCAMRAMIEGKPTPVFDETPDEHRARYHANLRVTKEDRIELERQLFEKFHDGPTKGLTE